MEERITWNNFVHQSKSSMPDGGCVTQAVVGLVAECLELEHEVEAGSEKSVVVDEAGDVYFYLAMYQSNSKWQYKYQGGKCHRPIKAVVLELANNFEAAKWQKKGFEHIDPIDAVNDVAAFVEEALASVGATPGEALRQNTEKLRNIDADASGSIAQQKRRSAQ